jgi:hypothetical protein
MVYNVDLTWRSFLLFCDHGNNDDDFSEQPGEDDDISKLLRDLACGLDDEGDMEDDGSFEPPNEDMAAIRKVAEAIRKVAENNSQELYLGCNNYSKLHFLVRLLHIKLIGGWNNISFDLLLDLLVDAVPGIVLPINLHEAKKVVKSMGVGYNTIHACENDCIFY